MSRFNPPKSIQEILQNTLKSLKIEQPIKKYSVLNDWKEIVGENIAEKAQPVRFMGDILIVSVVSHPWMTELTLMKPLILEKMHKQSKDCPFKNIRFELASSNKNSSKAR